MDNLADYVMAHTERGECNCGRCFDRGDKPDPSGHTIDVFFFKLVARGTPDADAFRALVRSHRGEWNEVDPFDGKEHGYIELGGWIGDQGLALQFMGLSAALGICRLLTPNMLPIPDDLKQLMAGQGMISIQALESAGAVRAVVANAGGTTG